MISLDIPKGKKFDIDKEITEAGNIKDKHNRDATVSGLKRIKLCL